MINFIAYKKIMNIYSVRDLLYPLDIIEKGVVIFLISWTNNEFWRLENATRVAAITASG